MTENLYSPCRLCPRECGADRSGGVRGRCGALSTPVVSRAALHMWEEPPISGTRGSGTIFFSGCQLGCIYCQNREISRSPDFGRRVDSESLAEIMLSLQKMGAHNINFVTPTHFMPHVAAAVDIARGRGLSVPTVYNTGGYEFVDRLRRLEGKIDIYLPDFKYSVSALALKYSAAADYPDIALRAIAEMVRQHPECRFSDDGIMLSGVIVRLLLLPGAVANTKLALSRLYSEFRDSIYISIMSQYTPPPGMPPPLNRRVSAAEYRDAVGHAEKLGIKNAFIQQRDSAEESYIPGFGDQFIAGCPQHGI